MPATINGFVPLGCEFPRFTDVPEIRDYLLVLSTIEVYVLYCGNNMAEAILFHYSKCWINELNAFNSCIIIRYQLKLLDKLTDSSN